MMVEFIKSMMVLHYKIEIDRKIVLQYALFHKIRYMDGIRVEN